MKNLLLILALGVLVAAAGCGRDHSVDPESRSAAWTLVRLVDSNGGPDGTSIDLAVLPAGELTLLDGRGNVVSSQGLLADGNLETLIRLVDALPPHSYAPESPCPSERFALTVTSEGRELSYVSGACDPAAPPEVSAVVAFLRTVTEETLEPFHKTVPVQIVLSGISSAIHSPERGAMRSQDELAALLRRHSPDRPVAVPRIDFGRRMVVAVFQGDRPTGGYQLASEGAGLAESGRLRIRFRSYEPGAGCQPEAGATQPFVLIAVDRSGDDYIVETAIETVICD